MPKGLFRVIVRGGDTGASEEGKEESLFGTCKIGSECLGGIKSKRLFANGVEFPDKAFFDLGCRFPRDSAGFELLARVTESSA